MVYQILGQVMILLLIIICCSRLFFLKFGKIDVLTVLAPVSLVLAVLEIIAWKTDVFSIILLVIALLTFFVNFRALLRFVSGLYVDHYSAAFKVGAIFVMVLAVSDLAFNMVFFPYAIFDRDINSSREIVRIHGNFNTGFSDCGIFEKSDGQVNVFTSAEKSNAVILFFPDKRGDTEKYIPFLKFLSEKGYTVCSADFFADDIKWFYSILDWRPLRREAMVMSYLENTVLFNSQQEFYTYNTEQECAALYNFAKEHFSEDSKFILFGDGMTVEGIKDYEKLNPGEFAAVEELPESEDYRTPGFGFIENLEPLLSAYLGYGRFNSFENIRRVADSADKKIREDTDGLIFEKDVKLKAVEEKLNDFLSGKTAGFMSGLKKVENDTEGN